MNIAALVPRDLKDKAVLLGWIGGLLLAGLLLWGLTQPLQARYLLRAVNRVLVSRQDSRRLSAPLGRHPVSANPMGIWYSMIDSDSVMCVFAVMRDGILVACGAQVSGEGRVEELLPLSGHAKQVIDQLPRAVTALYIRRIEKAAAGRSGR
jgi:hypothetical protein